MDPSLPTPPAPDTVAPSLTRLHTYIPDQIFTMREAIRLNRKKKVDGFPEHRFPVHVKKVFIWRFDRAGDKENPHNFLIYICKSYKRDARKSCLGFREKCSKVIAAR